MWKQSEQFENKISPETTHFIASLCFENSVSAANCMNNNEDGIYIRYTGPKCNSIRKIIDLCRDGVFRRDS